MNPQDRTRAILRSGLEPSLKIVLVALADHMDTARDVCWPGVETIAAESGYCERQAREILDDCESRGLIVRWSGEHKSRDIRIVWEALATAKATPSTRGGRRVPAKTATKPAKTAGEQGGKDCHPNRQSLPPQPAIIATITGKDCTRSDHEATSEATSEATTPKAPVPGAVRVEPEPPPATRTATASVPVEPGVPRWTPPARECNGHPRSAVAAAMLACIEAVRQGPVTPDNTATDAKAVLGLWRALGRPEPALFADDFRLVATWAQESPDPAAARNLRAEGWEGGVYRARSVATMTRQAAWGDRLDAARAWDGQGRPTTTAADPPRTDPASDRKRAELARGDRELAEWAEMAGLETVHAPTQRLFQGTA